MCAEVLIPNVVPPQYLTGKLAMMRRMAGSLVKMENYYKADIIMGKVSY